MRHCTSPGCNRPVLARALCGRHYQRALAAGALPRVHVPPQFQRFMERVSPEPMSGCWLWVGAYKTTGYGNFLRNTSAHRAAWGLFHGPIPQGRWVLHRCDNRACVNPEHLFLGTHRDNMVDAFQKGRGRLPHRVGAAAPNARLTEAEVRDIRLLREEGATLEGLATQFGVGRSTVKRIVYRHCWRNVA